MEKEINEVLSYFDENTKNILLNSNLLKDKPTEIRLRLNQNIICNINKQNIKIENYIITKEILENIFYSICEYSVNAFEKEISNGFIIIKGGHRVGIGGVFSSAGKINILKELLSLNIRIAYDKSFEFLCENFEFNKGILILGSPHTGKTTFLKSLIKQLSKDENVCVCDEREELIIKNSSVDTIKRIAKSVAIEMATRTLNPNIIICDEIGDESESRAILSSVNTGVKFICTAHANSLQEAKKRPSIKKLIDNNVFDKIIVLENKLYKVREIIDV